MVYDLFENLLQLLKRWAQQCQQISRPAVAQIRVYALANEYAAMNKLITFSCSSEICPCGPKGFQRFQRRARTLEGKSFIYFKKKKDEERSSRDSQIPIAGLVVF